MTTDGSLIDATDREVEAREATVAMIATWLNRHPRPQYGDDTWWPDWAARNFLADPEVRAHVTLVAARVGQRSTAHTEETTVASERILILNENTNRGDETGAGIMRNRCAFTSRDMGADWPEAFTYAVVLGWDGENDEDDPMPDMAARYGWDAEMVAFLRDTHTRFAALPDKRAAS